MIEELTREKDEKDKAADWQTWVPELEKEFKDKMMSLIAERFKLESIAQSAKEQGAQNIQDVLKLLSSIENQARRRYPRLVWLDSIYKYMGDMRVA